MDRFLKVFGALICLITLLGVVIILVQTPPVPGFLAIFITILPAAAFGIVSGLAIIVAGAFLGEVRQIRAAAEQQTQALQDMALVLKAARNT